MSLQIVSCPEDNHQATKLKPSISSQSRDANSPATFIPRGFGDSGNRGLQFFIPRGFWDLESIPRGPRGIFGE